MRRSVLLDVDGVVADLVGGMRKFTVATYGIDFDPRWVVYHDRMGRSPMMSDIHDALKAWFPEEADEEYNGFGGAFRCFMKDRDVYGQYIDPIPGAVDAVAAIREEHDVVFVTALMKSARDHFRSKMEWIERWFPGIPIITAPSGEKWRVFGDFAVDDRYDTCERWWRRGVSAMVFEQTWNEIPAAAKATTLTWNWDRIRTRLCDE